MAHYIDKDAVVAEIERKRNDYINSLMTEQVHVLNDVLDFLDTLEVKEVDLEIDLDAAINAYMDKNFGEPWDGVRPVGSFELAIMAEHFFELGMAVGNKE